MKNEISNKEENYETIRFLETRILNHPQTVATKITFMKLIDKGFDVTAFYDLKDIGTRNIYLQVINTYYKKEIADYLLSKLE